VMNGAQARDPRAVAAFRAEVRAVARLDHPGVVLVLDCGEVSAEAAAASRDRLVAGSPFLAMELLRGRTLADRADGLAWSGVAASLTSLLEALAHAHARGVLHRDLKPSNVLFAGRGAHRPGLRLTDFGLARAFAGDRFDAAGALEAASDEPEEVAGSPLYMAPEALTGGAMRRARGPISTRWAASPLSSCADSGRSVEASTSWCSATSTTLRDRSLLDSRSPTAWLAAELYARLGRAGRARSASARRRSERLRATLRPPSC
jgi:serine/threonine protein kinase